MTNYVLMHDDFIALGTPTVPTSLKQCREYWANPRPPGVMKRGTFNEMYDYLVEVAGNSRRCNSAEKTFTGQMPVWANEDWTYWVMPASKIPTPLSN